MRVGGKYLVRLDMGLFGIIPKRIWLYAGNPDLSLDNQQERSRLDRGNPQRLYAKPVKVLRKQNLVGMI